jgi:Glycosyltransferase family 87
MTPGGGVSGTIAACLARLRRGEWLDRKRVLAYCGMLLAVELAGFAFVVAGTHGLVVPLDRPSSTDFVSFYAAGSLADAGTPALAYNHIAHFAAEVRAREPGIVYNFFYYPPVFLLLCGALARLPYMVAFVVLEAASLVAFLLVGRRILEERGWAVAVPLLAFPAVFWTIGLGQNSFLTAALFGAATLFVDRRPVLAGLLFGALCYKPHLGLLVPVALAAGGRWRVFAGAAASVAGLVLLSLALFGEATWHAYLLAAAASPATYDSGRIHLSGYATPMGAVLLLGGGRAGAYAVQAAMTLVAAGIVGLVWRRGASLPARAATLAAGTLVAVPVALFYDLMLAALAGLWLIRAGREGGGMAWERTALAVLFLAPLAPRYIGAAWHVPVACIAVLGVFAIAAARARREISERRAGDAAMRPGGLALTRS